MKYLRFAIIVLNICFIQIKAQRNLVGIEEISYKLVEWNLKTKFPYTISNFNSFYRYSFNTKNVSTNVNMVDFESAEKYILAQDKLMFPDSVKSENKTVCAQVEIKFYRGKKIKLFFDNKGNYFYKNTLYTTKKDLYIFLFKYFSNVITPKLED